MSVPIDTNLRLQNDSKPTAEGWWEWSVWVEGPDDEVNSLESVTYRLHPTFPNPVQTVTDPSTRFRLRGIGWGEFSIVADVHYRDGRSARLERWLELQEESGAGPSSPRQPMVFVSHSVADNAMVYALTKSLIAQGVQVVTEESLEAGSDWQESIRERIKSVDVVLPIVSDPASDFVVAEAKLAQSVGRPVLPIIIGNAALPSSLSSLARFELRESKNIAGLADSVVARVKDLVTPEEA